VRLVLLQNLQWNGQPREEKMEKQRCGPMRNFLA
jgi:hypothetical protein